MQSSATDRLSLDRSHPLTRGHSLAIHCRDVSLEFAKQLFPQEPAVIGEVFDALQLGALCNRTKNATTGTGTANAPHDDQRANGHVDTRRRHVREGVSLTAVDARDNVFFVDAMRGDDAGGDGTVGAPYQTIHRGVAAARQAMRQATQVNRLEGDDDVVKGRRGDEFLSAPRATVVLREGTHYLGHTLVLGPDDSRLTITSVAGEEAVVSGGTPITGLTWRKAGAPLPDGVYVADLPANPNTTSFDAMFVGERLEIRARWPNG
jgi:hypothetical protein